MILAAISIVLIIAGIWLSLRDTTKVEKRMIGQPTTFAALGALNFVAQKGSDVPTDPYFVYQEDVQVGTQEDGKPALVSKLEFDVLSFCQTSASGQNGSTPCLAMNVTLDIPFNDKQAVVEGIMKDDNTILVRRLRIIGENETSPSIPATGIVYVSWPEARDLIASCGVESVSQSHDLTVRIETSDGKKISTVEPIIDEVFGVTRVAEKTCGKIPLSTE